MTNARDISKSLGKDGVRLLAEACKCAEKTIRNDLSRGVFASRRFGPIANLLCALERPVPLSAFDFDAMPENPPTLKRL